MAWITTSTQTSRMQIDVFFDVNDLRDAVAGVEAFISDIGA